MELLTVDSLLNVISELLSDETSFAVSNETEYIYYHSSKRIDLKIKPGDPVKEGTITYKALTSKQKVSEFITRDVLGVPYHGIAVPYYHEGKMKGCITAIFPALADAKSVVTVKLNDGWVPIPFSDVIYIEARDRKTYVFGKETIGTHRYTLNEFEYFLPKDFFVRCHRSFIVNVHYIKEIYPDTHSTFILVMKNNTKVPVSQSYSSYFRKLLLF
ncbi:LytTR family DNA-binding domain-containing protein [Bacillus sp. EB600]|uniref:LytTR family DNA-binding domain-containing protein n=1 Tax=Bacillus sp. EB600 TaxID=2806345 RepID=UPI00210C4978|nr:LytTR family DNA-binding domain-containing protein [Bacillus sp. EB600]MCQ6282043.1 LytTR family transcriptional regulator DNA-binding domain-containing protein [Bacillus sp. EB600]